MVITVSPGSAVCSFSMAAADKREMCLKHLAFVLYDRCGLHLICG
jgi:hypothetical protein